MINLWNTLTLNSPFDITYMVISQDKVPHPDPEIKKLVKNTSGQFNFALRTRSGEDFRGKTLSTSSQGQTPTQILNTFLEYSAKIKNPLTESYLTYTTERGDALLLHKSRVQSLRCLGTQIEIRLTDNDDPAYIITKDGSNDFQWIMEALGHKDTVWW